MVKSAESAQKATVEHSIRSTRTAAVCFFMRRIVPKIKPCGRPGLVAKSLKISAIRLSVVTAWFFRSPDHPITSDPPMRYTFLMRVLGIDCGSEYTGYGVVKQLGDRELVCLTSGAIKLRSRDRMASKLEKIFVELKQIIAEHQPEVAAIEDVFYA